MPSIPMPGILMPSISLPCGAAQGCGYYTFTCRPGILMPGIPMPGFRDLYH
jgi:hypothetical protein